MQIKILQWGKGILDHFCSCDLDLDLDSMTFICEFDPYSPGNIPEMRKWTSYVKAVESYRITACECVYLDTCGHFPSRYKDGGHTTVSAVSENPILHANFMALCFIEPELLPIKVLHCRNIDFPTFLLLWPWPWPDDFHIRAWPIFPGDIPDVQIWTSHVKAFENCLTDIHTYRQTDTAEIIYHAGSRMVKNLD